MEEEVIKGEDMAVVEDMVEVAVEATEEVDIKSEDTEEVAEVDTEVEVEAVRIHMGEASTVQVVAMIDLAITAACTTQK